MPEHHLCPKVSRCAHQCLTYYVPWEPGWQRHCPVSKWHWPLTQSLQTKAQFSPYVPFRHLVSHLGGMRASSWSTHGTWGPPASLHMHGDRPVYHRGGLWLLKPGERYRHGLSPLPWPWNWREPARLLPYAPWTLGACSGAQHSSWDALLQTLVPRIGSRAAEPFSDPVPWENQGS